MEAKIVLGENLVVSLATEFIENENENVLKQGERKHLSDCLKNIRMLSTAPYLHIG